LPTPNNIIDLKQAQLFIVDGYSNAGAVNHTSGYTTTTTTMAVDSITGVISDGTTFTVAGDETVYEVIDHAETSGNTTSITFTPGLVVATTDDEVITFQPHQIEVRIGEGNFTYTDKVDRQYKKNRGRLDTVRNGDEQQMDVAFDFVWDHIIGATDDPITVEEALKGINNASNWVSSSADPCEPYAVDLVILYTPVCTGVDAERIVFEDFRYESLDHNLKDGSVSSKGSCNRTLPVVTRQAAA
jgi:hypothetical protein